MRYLIVTKWSYPMGGGEEFMYQTMKWMTEEQHEVMWLSFTDKLNKEYDKFELIKDQFGDMLHVNGGLTINNAIKWIELISPDVIHHQGSCRSIIMNAAKKFNIPFITGFHFWNGGIILSNKYMNMKILENISNHTKDPELDEIIKYSTIYLASNFMKQIFEQVTKYKFENILEPISDEALVCDKFVKEDAQSFLTRAMNIYDRKYVTMVNIHKLKGGELLLYYLLRFPDISFYAIRTEPLSDDLDNKIKDIMASRSNCIFSDRVNDMKKVYSMTKILLIPSIVDETYCRVACEGLLNHIPIITTGSGNIKNILKDSAIYVDLISNKKLLDDALIKLYYNKDVFIHQVFKSIIVSKDIKSTNTKNKFLNLLPKPKKIMFYVPWTDQGLGIQTKNYVNILHDLKIETCIFSYYPYSDITQANSDEWKHEFIYYSKNNREQVTDKEILDFIQKYNVGTCVIPETCFFRIFQIAKLLKKSGIKTICIPNIEIVRKDEIELHKLFDLILCNNKICQDKFLELGFNNLEYLGFAIESKNISNIYLDNKITFLFLGGLNAFTRKNVLKVLEAFTITKKHKLICCIQKISEQQSKLIEKYNNLDNIKIITNHLSSEQIGNLYLESNCVIQVSSHEGLGLGFFEGLSYSLPVITLDTKPHNEIIIDQVTGLIVPCAKIPVPDNNQSIINAASFDIKDLVDVLNDIDLNKIYIMKENCRKANDQLYRDFVERCKVLFTSTSKPLTIS